MLWIHTGFNVSLPMCKLLLPAGDSVFHHVVCQEIDDTAVRLFSIDLAEFVKMTSSLTSQAVPKHIPVSHNTIQSCCLIQPRVAASTP